MNAPDLRLEPFLANLICFPYLDYPQNILIVLESSIASL
jgi:hypothetical protein